MCRRRPQPPNRPAPVRSSGKTLLIRQQPAFHAQIAHHRIGVEEALRGLNQGHLRILQKTDAALQKHRLRDEVGIEDRHQFGVDVAQSVVEVSRFGIGALWTVT